MTAPRCDTCRWAKNEYVGPQGRWGLNCHRHPPTAIEEDGIAWRAFPIVEKGDFCGEHTPHHYAERKAA